MVEGIVFRRIAGENAVVESLGVKLDGLRNRKREENFESLDSVCDVIETLV